MKLLTMLILAFATTATGAMVGTLTTVHDQRHAEQCKCGMPVVYWPGNAGQQALAIQPPKCSGKLRWSDP